MSERHAAASDTRTAANTCSDSWQGAARRGPVALVVSPHAGAGQVAGASQPDPRELLAAASVEVGEVLRVSELDHRLPQGERWRERGFSAVVAAGGDGTIGAVATQVAGSGLPLGILPMGTSNDVARSLDIPLDLADACRVVAGGMPVDVDAGQTLPAMTQPGALSTEANDPPATNTSASERTELATHGAYFMHALTLGLNVSFARLATDVARRQRWGTLTYAASAIEALATFQPVPIRMRLAGCRMLGPDSVWHEKGEAHLIDCRVVQVAVINTPVFGGGMNLRLPRVELHDQMLDFLVLEALEPPRLRTTIQGLLDSLARLAEGMRKAGSAATETRGEIEPRGTSSAEVSSETTESDDAAAGFALPGVSRFQARAAVIETPRDVDVTLDGEIRAHTPVVVRVAPQPVRVLVRRAVE